MNSNEIDPWEITEENMTKELALKIMKFRFWGPNEYRGTWRRVAELMGDEDGNQLLGKDLCRMAYDFLGEEEWWGNDREYSANQAVASPGTCGWPLKALLAATFRDSPSFPAKALP